MIYHELIALSHRWTKLKAAMVDYYDVLGVSKCVSRGHQESVSSNGLHLSAAAECGGLCGVVVFDCK